VLSKCSPRLHQKNSLKLAWVPPFGGMTLEGGPSYCNAQTHFEGGCGGSQRCSQ
jgi:hypothetical protein